MLICVGLSVTPRTVACQAPLSMGFPRQEYWSCQYSFSRGSFQPRDGTHVSCVSCLGRWILYHYCHLGIPRSLMPSSQKKKKKRGFLIKDSFFTDLAKREMVIRGMFRRIKWRTLFYPTALSDLHVLASASSLRINC